MRGYGAAILKNAKRLRRDMTDAERTLWSVLRARQMEGAKFRRQQPVGTYIVDFLCAEAMLVVEVDGGQHVEERDSGRTADLEALGYCVIRFWNHEVLGNLDGVREAIRSALAPSP